MISYLADFASRMEHISEIASVICRRNRNLAIEASFGDNELDNIIFAVLVHIMERSLTTNVRCTLEDIEDFLAELFKDYNREINESELRELTRYIVKDILQNKGESFKFKIMDHSDLTIKSYSVRLIRDIEDDDGVIYYVLEKQGFDMLFRTKEVDDLGFQLEEVRLHKLIERGNFSDASSQSKRLLAMLNQKEIDLTLFERRMKNDLSETSGEEYDTLIHEIEQMLDDEYAVMSDIKKTIGKAIESFSDSNAFSDRVKNELADKKRNIFMISNNTEKILVKQRELLSHSRELGQLYREMLLKTITMHRTHCYDIEDVILKLLEEYKGNNKLYDPTEGEITLNGIDIRKYKYEEYMELFSVVFQDSKLFSFSLAENVAADTEYDPERVTDCVIRAGLGDRLKTMENGIETCLYKDFDENGVEISGGEAQKLCLARAIYKGSPFIVLDEPTAALDPISEYDIYTKFNSIVGTRTAIYISHRLSSCRFCDDITVLDNGHIIERGSHEKLIAKGGIYTAMWAAQAEYYKDTAGELFA